MTLPLRSVLYKAAPGMLNLPLVSIKGGLWVLLRHLVRCMMAIYNTARLFIDQLCAALMLWQPVAGCSRYNPFVVDTAHSCICVTQVTLPTYQVAQR